MRTSHVSPNASWVSEYKHLYLFYLGTLGNPLMLGGFSYKMTSFEAIQVFFFLLSGSCLSWYLSLRDSCHCLSKGVSTSEWSHNDTIILRRANSARLIYKVTQPCLGHLHSSIAERYFLLQPFGPKNHIHVTEKSTRRSVLHQRCYRAVLLGVN